MTPTWILLRGLTREHRHWGSFPQLLRQQLAVVQSDVRVLCPDLPGSGVLRTQHAPLAIADMLAAVRQQLPADCAPPYVVVGLSMGGMLAAEWAQRRPHELAGCVLINASLGAFNPPWQRMRWRAGAACAGIALHWRDAAWSERAIWRLTSNRPCDPKVLAAWRFLRQSGGIAPINAVRQLIAAARCRGAKQPPAVPVLILGSARDRLVSFACAERIAAAWQAPLRSHTWGGHDLPLDDGPWVAATLVAWARGLQAAVATTASPPPTAPK